MTVIIFTSLFFLTGCETETEKKSMELKVMMENEQISIYNEEITVPGLKKEVNLDFMADAHISLCDERDIAVYDKASQRYEAFLSPQGEKGDVTFKKMMDYVRVDSPDFLILGGDIIDSAMSASIEFVQEELESVKVPWIYSMGNHDFEYGTEYFSEKAYEEYLPRLKKISNTESGYQIIEQENFVIFAADDKNNQVAKSTVEGMRSLINKGKPILLVMHVPIEPLVENTLWEESVRIWGVADNGNARVLIGEHSCVPDETTQEFLDIVLDENSPIFLVLAGHVHFYHKDNLTDNIPQIVTGAAYQKQMVHITLKPEK